MPYTVTLTRGAVFANIADGTINQTSTMTLIGRDFANYGQFVDQDLVRLLESGAATQNRSATSALTGQLWFDLTNTQLKVATLGNIPNGAAYTTSGPIKWQGASPAYSVTAPVNPVVGDTWMYTNTNANIPQMVVWTGDTANTNFLGNLPGWKVIGPTTRSDIVEFGTINADYANFDETVNIDVLYANVATVAESVLIGQYANGANVNTAFLQVLGDGIYGNLNGDQPYVTSLGNASNGFGYLSNIQVGSISGGALTTINSNVGITTTGSITGVQITGSTIQATGGGFYGLINAATSDQKFIYGLGVQAQAYSTANSNAIVRGGTSAGLAVSRKIVVDYGNGFAGVSDVDIGEPSPTGPRFRGVYANTFFGNLSGQILGDVPSISSNDIVVPSADGLILIGSGNLQQGTGNVRIDGGNGTGSFNNAIYIGRPGGNYGNGNVGIIHSYGTSTVFGGVGNILTFTDLTGNCLYDFYKDVRVRGNLYVLGNTVTTSVTEVTTNDLDIVVANNVQTGNIVNASGAGIVVGANATIKMVTVVAGSSSAGYDAQRWQMNRSLEITSDSPATGGSIGDLRVAGNVYACTSASIASLNITGTGGIVSTGANVLPAASLTSANRPIIDGSTGTVGYAAGLYDAATGRYYWTEEGSALSGTPYTAVVRDVNGSINATEFSGIATKARYADLAEMYLADREYAPGTLVTVGGDAEITQCTINDHPLGVVSTNPAYLMNTALENGTPVALRGRVPVRITGAVHKGDKLGPSEVPGLCTKNNQAPIAIALHNAYAEPGTETTVEAVIL